MMRKCCFCVELRLGCLIIGVIRLFLWLVVLLAGFYTAIHIFSPDNHGMFHYSARINIERNSYVVLMIIIVSLAGVSLEPLMMVGVIQRYPPYIKIWFVMTIFTLLASVVMAMSFLLQNLGIFKVGQGWFSDAMCVLADIVFYFVPEYLLGPRLVPMLITLLILAHMALPVFHAFSYYIVYSFFKVHICDIYGLGAQGVRMAGVGTGGAPTASNGGTLNAPLLEHQDTVVYEGTATMSRAGGQYKPRLCQKCQLAYEENGGAIYRCTSTPLLKPIETTC